MGPSVEGGSAGLHACSLVPLVDVEGGSVERPWLLCGFSLSMAIGSLTSRGSCPGVPGSQTVAL